MPTLHWIGKEKVINHHQDVPYRLLEHKYGFDNGEQSDRETTSGNKIVHGDNLEALKSLLPEYEGKIKCIYIDPPYNTGNESWVYNDNVNHPKIKKWLGQVVGKEGEDLSRHDKWLCMMYPRLKLLHKLLADDGAIFISIDDNEQANLKLLCDEIFGPGNFLACISNVSNPKGRSDGKFIASAHEYVIAYKKAIPEVYGWDPDEKITRRYNKKDANGKYREIDLRKTGDNDLREDRPNLFYFFYFNPKSNHLYCTRREEVKDGYIKIIPKRKDGLEGNWRWGIESAEANIDKLIARVMPTRNEYSVFEKDYLTDKKKVTPTSAWTKKEFNSERGSEIFIKLGFSKSDFPRPKPCGLLEHIIKYITKDNDIILDSFAGSGTTAHAVLNLNKEDGGNRKFILVEMEEYSDSITAERVRRVINGYGEGKSAVEGTGGAFDYYDLGEPLFKDRHRLNESVPFVKLKDYIYYTETGLAITKSEDDDSPYFLGVNQNCAYYLYHKPGETTTLDYDFLATVKVKAEQYIIYAGSCLLPLDFLKENNIIFKKVPRDIRRL